MAGKKKTGKKTKKVAATEQVTVQVEVVPVSGAKTTKTVKLASGATVAEVLKAAGVSVDAFKKDLLVNGKPATPETHVTQNDSVRAKEVKLQVSERPAGS